MSHLSNCIKQYKALCKPFMPNVKTKINYKLKKYVISCIILASRKFSLTIRTSKIVKFRCDEIILIHEIQKSQADFFLLLFDHQHHHYHYARFKVLFYHTSQFVYSAPHYKDTIKEKSNRMEKNLQQQLYVGVG